MKMVSTLAVAAMLAGVAVGASPAEAQRVERAQQAQAAKQQKGAPAPVDAAAAEPKRNYSKGAVKALQELQAAVAANDAANFPAKLAAAQAVAKTPDDRYLIAQLQLRMAQAAKDDAGMRAAITAMLNSGAATAADKPTLYKALGGLALNAKDNAGAIAAYQEVLKLTPNDPDVLNNMVVIYREQKNYPQAVALLEQRIAASKAAGQKVDERTYRAALQTALDGKLSGKIMPLTRDFLAAYPGPQNWQVALDLFRQGAQHDDATLLDTFRLMRAAKTLNQTNEYLALADTLALGRFYAEARDVVNEGVAARKFAASHPGAAQVLKEVNPKIAEDRAALAGLESRARGDAKGTLSLRLAEGYYGHGMHAKAAEFYRLALQKGGVDANLVNTRLGMALALSGQRAEAEAAFKAVTGPRADLAGLWMLWLANRA